jgi:hypothetical protein
VVRSVEKLLKIERPTKLSEMKLETLEAFPTLPKLDLTNIETCTEPALAVHIDLGLDQLEEPEE